MMAAEIVFQETRKLLYTTSA